MAPLWSAARQRSFGFHFAPGEPGLFYPTGTRHYFRVVTTDDLQGPAGALLAQSLNLKKVYVLDDNGAYGKGIADLFKVKSKSLGIDLKGGDTLDAKSPQIKSIVSHIVKANPDLIFYGGDLTVELIALIKELRASGYKGAMMGPDALWAQDLIVQGGKDVEGFYVTSVGIPVDKLTSEPAKKFLADYVQAFGVEPEIFSGTAFEAASIVIAAIGQGGEDKARVLGAMKKINAQTPFEGLYGKVFFDDNGDVNQKILSAGVVKNGTFEFVRSLSLP